MNYSTLEGSQGICPQGWHIPTRWELDDMDDYIRVNSFELPEHYAGQGIVNSNNSLFIGQYVRQFAWSSTEKDSIESFASVRWYDEIAYGQISYNKNNHHISIKCLKD